MAWQTIDRNKPAVDPDAGPALDEAVRDKIRSFFDRYETKRAALLPALQVTQDALGHVSLAAMVEIAEVLELRPSEVFDTIGFYTHFWTRPKGAKVIVCCRSITCDVMGAGAVLQAFKEALGIDEHQTTPDGKYSLMTEECLAGCDHAPCVLINERLHKRVKPADVPKLLADAENDKLDIPRSDLFDAPQPQTQPTSNRTPDPPAESTGASAGSG
ncbi:MAG TPA: NAD(P)H-dependent oxidoreductase subunit E [Phycisphaerae bacterium]|nr:NAD(P)H-dependent oxidoreductase subunit E [Phycisphaerae bacterium]